MAISFHFQVSQKSVSVLPGKNHLSDKFINLKEQNKKSHSVAFVFNQAKPDIHKANLATARYS